MVFVINERMVQNFEKESLEMGFMFQSSLEGNS